MWTWPSGIRALCDRDVLWCSATRILCFILSCSTVAVAHRAWMNRCVHSVVFCEFYRNLLHKLLIYYLLCCMRSRWALMKRTLAVCRTFNLIKFTFSGIGKLFRRLSVWSSGDGGGYAYTTDTTHTTHIQAIMEMSQMNIKRRKFFKNFPGDNHCLIKNICVLPDSSRVMKTKCKHVTTHELSIRSATAAVGAT